MSRRQREEWGSPPAGVDRDHLDTFQWTTELLAEYADRARQMIDSLWSVDVAGLERITQPGPCEECDHQALVLYRRGQFVLCRRCARRRLRAGRRPASEQREQLDDRHGDWQARLEWLSKVSVEETEEAA